MTPPRTGVRTAALWPQYRAVLHLSLMPAAI